MGATGPVPQTFFSQALVASSDAGGDPTPPAVPLAAATHAANRYGRERHPGEHINVGTVERCNWMPAGSTLDIDVVISGIPQEVAGIGGISGFQLDLVYDSEAVEIAALTSMLVTRQCRLDAIPS